MSLDGHLLLMCDVTDPMPTAGHTETLLALMLRARIMFTELLPGNVLIKYATVGR
jgi:hypothetical protein